MPPIEPIAAGRVSLVDAVDHLLNRGAVLSGDATISIAGIDLVYVGLNLLVSSVQTLQQRGDWLAGPAALPRRGPAPAAPRLALSPDREVEGPGAEGEAVTQPATSGSQETPYQVVDLDAKPAQNDSGESSLARLVLMLVELLRQLVERQALRRVEDNGLSEEQVERMGRALLELSEKMRELRTLFGIEEQDLTIDLGPLGRLV